MRADKRKRRRARPHGMRFGVVLVSALCAISLFACSNYQDTKSILSEDVSFSTGLLLRENVLEIQYPIFLGDSYELLGVAEELCSNFGSEAIDNSHYYMSDSSGYIPGRGKPYADQLEAANMEIPEHDKKLVDFVYAPINIVDYREPANWRSLPSQIEGVCEKSRELFPNAKVVIPVEVLMSTSYEQNGIGSSREEYDAFIEIVASLHFDNAIVLPFVLEDVAITPDGKLTKEDHYHPNESGVTLIVERVYAAMVAQASKFS